ncbi:MAG: NAD(P)-dependent oxidoreductase [Desulfobacterales bacterium]|jgi:uronate dehydrogenase
MSRKKILITGAAGSIGKVLKASLKKWYQLRLLCHQNILPAESDEEVCLGSITDPSKMVEASTGVNAVVHLAANSWEDSAFEEVLQPNIIGTYTVFEACRQAGVGRIIYASSNHVTGYYEIERTYTTAEMPVRPDGYYGVSKVFGEALGRYYADAFGISVICIRIGTCRSKSHVIKRDDDRILSTWLSHRDMVQLVRRSIEAEAIRFGIYYGISGNTRAYWDIENARKEIGYAPQDNAETYA